MRQALTVAHAHGLTAAALRAQFNLAGLAIEFDRLLDARSLFEDAIAAARRRGDRAFEARGLGELADVLAALGEWDEALARLDELHGADEPFVAISVMSCQATVGVGRGDVRAVRALLHKHAGMRSSSDRQDRATYLLVEAAVCRAEGRLGEALSVAGDAMRDAHALQLYHYSNRARVEAIEAALALDDLATAERLLDEAEHVALIERRDELAAQLARLGARLDARRGADGLDGRFELAAASFARLGLRPLRAVTLLEHAESLCERGRAAAAAPLLAEAREEFERLGARPWLARADALAQPLADVV
jgi:hypothetical protein